jgi:transcriptional regulator GlxA family with amidase domain
MVGRSRYPHREQRMSQKLQLAIALYPGFTAMDAIGPYEVLKLLPDTETRFVSHEPGPVVTDRGVLIVGATHSFEETPNPDLILVPGSEATTTTAMADSALIAWLKQSHTSSRFTTSVCSGALVLAAAGILEGLPATTHWWGQSSLARFGATASPHERTVRSGKVWTAAGVSAGIDLALSLAAEIAGREQAEIAQLRIEYDPRPPFDAGHPDKASEEVRTKAAAALARDAHNPQDLVSIPKILWRRAIEKARLAIGRPS